MAARATSHAIVASAVRRALLVLAGEGPDGDEDVGRAMDHAPELACERNEHRPKQHDEEGTPIVHAGLAYAISKLWQPPCIPRRSPLR
jgi:hypothetical protein